MTIDYSVHAPARLVTYTVEGTPTPETFREFFDAVAEHAVFEPGFAFLGDCRLFAGDPHAALVRAVASDIRARSRRLGPCKWALVFSTAGGFAAVRVCGLLTHGTGIEFASFLTAAEAEKWLGVDLPGAKDIVFCS